MKTFKAKKNTDPYTWDQIARKERWHAHRLDVKDKKVDQERGRFPLQLPAGQSPVDGMISDNEEDSIESAGENLDERVINPQVAGIHSGTRYTSNLPGSATFTTDFSSSL